MDPPAFLIDFVHTFVSTDYAGARRLSDKRFESRCPLGTAATPLCIAMLACDAGPQRCKVPVSDVSENSIVHSGKR
jgi:hypothetical protein